MDASAFGPDSGATHRQRENATRLDWGDGFRGRKVLVTGGTGFIGGRLVERLVLETGAQVRILVHNWSRAAWVARVPCEFMAGDVTDPVAVAAAVEGCSIIFHCASGGNSDAEYLHTNLNGTREVLEAAKRQGCSRIVYLSSVVVHGANPPGEVAEDSPFLPTGRGYADSKIEAEKLIWQYWQDYHLPVVVLRPTFVWGPRSGQFTVGPVTSMKAGTFRLVDAGAGSCHAVYVDNLVDAMLLAAAKEAAVGQAFLITDGPDRTWGQYFKCYARMLGINSLRSVRSTSTLIKSAARLSGFLDRVLVRLSPNPAPIWRRGLRRSARIVRTWLAQKGIPTTWHLMLFARQGRLSIAKAQSLLGYVPRISLETGMHETEQWLRDQLCLIMGTANDPIERV